MPHSLFSPTTEKVRAPPAAERTGDVFVLHPKGRSDAALALTGQDLLRLKLLLESVASSRGPGGSADLAATLAGRLGRYVAGLK